MHVAPITKTRKIRHAHLFCGLGGGARGFNRASPRVANMQAKFVCVGGIDSDVGAIRNFERIAGVRGTVMDLFDRQQFIEFHGEAPDRDWKEATPDDIRKAFGPQVDVMFLSAPCKGFSGLLSSKKSKTDKYQALNRLTLRGVWLALEAYKDNPIPVILFENVPRILTRGKWLLDQIMALLRSYGYSVNLDTHDCGIIGNLAQSRKRALLIGRHIESIPPFIYQPREHRLRGVGEVIGKLPLPGDPIAGSMHRVPSLQWKTWLRLALVPAGKDWRALNDLAVVDGNLRDFGIVPEIPLRDNALGVNDWDDTAPVITSHRAPGQGRFSVADPRPQDGWHNDVLGVRGWDDAARVVAGASRPHNGAHSVADVRYGDRDRDSTLGVKEWEQPSGTIQAKNGPTNGAFSVADPRPKEQANQTYQQYGVNKWHEHIGTVSGQSAPGGGAHSIADIRIEGKPRFNNVFKIVPFDGTAPAVAGPGGPAGGVAVADPRPSSKKDYTTTKYKVTPYDNCSRAVIGASTTGDGAFAVADPRPNWGNQRHSNILRVTPFDEAVGTIAANAHSVTGGQACVADKRKNYQTGGHYGVVDWEQSAYAVSGSACHDNGFNSVADPRDADLDVSELSMPKPNERLVCRIIATDGTWHRPFTTLDLAALQSLFEPEEVFFKEETEHGEVWRCREHFDLDASSDVTKREWIGNMVPGAAATGIAETIGETIMLADMGESFFLSPKEIWAKPAALALSVDNDQTAFRLDNERGDKE